MSGEYQYLNLRDEQVFSAHYFPTWLALRAIVMCDPLGEAKLRSHRVFVALARDMAAAGLAALRFDHRGEGDSGRHSEQSNQVKRSGLTRPATGALTVVGKRQIALSFATEFGRRT